MRTVLHLLKTDLRRFALLIAAWIVLTAAGQALYAAAPGMSLDRQRFSTIGDALGLLWLARHVVRIVLVVGVVHAHSAIGSTAFWMTRPIPAATLLAAKALLVFGIGAGIPVAADLALAVAYRMPASAAIPAALQTALVNGLWVAAFALLAVMTRSLAQFSLVIGGIVVTLAVSVAVASSTGTAWRPFRGPVDPLAGFMVGALLVCGLAAAWLVQYARRNRGATLSAAAAALCCSFVPIVVGVPAPHRALPAWANGLTLHAPQDPYVESVEVRLPGGERATWSVVRAQLTIPELPAGWFARAAVREGTVEVPGASLPWPGTPVFGTSAIGRRRGKPHPVEMATREAMGLSSVRSHGEGNSPWYDADSVVLFAQRADQRTIYAAGTYRGRVALALVRAEVVGELPLTRDAVFQDGEFRIRLLDVVLRTGDVSVVFERTGAAVVATRPPRVHYELILSSRARGEGVRGYSTGFRPQGLLPMFSEPAILTTGFKAETIAWHYAAPLWLDEARLEVVRTTTAGSITRELHLPSVPIVPRQRP